MKLTITIFLVLPLGLSACGSLVQDQLLNIQMYGSRTIAETASGTSAPDYLSYQLKEVALVSTDGSTLTTLFANEDERIFRIIDRPQIIFSKDIANLEGISYSALRLTFADTITGGDEKYSDYSFTMAQASLVLTETFSIEKAKSITFSNKVNWGDTVTDETMTEPTYTLTKD